MAGPRWLDDHQQRAWRGYLAMQAQLQAQLGRRLQAESGISLADFDVLVALSERDAPLRVQELADGLQWEKSRLSHHLARMQKRGLVERQDCPDDARGAFIVLSIEGRRAIEQAAPGHVEAVRALVFDGLDDRQVEAWAAISDEVLARVEQDRAKGS
ncbi:MarR family winged helix-turn-helix transcriptional regulator [Actinomycetospora lemnae]|uniref:MarR family transcriptional regulator n=1 Tax=Actinomycetospora lemnae TaxID=3019891 RepID=A0ABT5SR48_9PSEU|nr:MarR family transcriptional regulator [Actinomycetospora sp. DW7H6]MDD7965325.1 MarR family transcriptional regulator [Actinomycetospora sp. DW7H6]